MRNKLLEVDRYTNIFYYFNITNYKHIRMIFIYYNLFN
jgi:hypothetical protein